MRFSFIPTCCSKAILCWTYGSKDSNTQDLKFFHGGLRLYVESNNAHCDGGVTGVSGRG